MSPRPRLLRLVSASERFASIPARYGRDLGFYPRAPYPWAELAVGDYFFAPSRSNLWRQGRAHGALFSQTLWHRSDRPIYRISRLA